MVTVESCHGNGTMMPTAELDTPTMTRKLIVVGAGPVGCLAAMSFAKMGWSVEIYEARPDMRLPSSRAAAQQRSINLAISSRGIAAMQAIDPAAASRFLDNVIPMRGRMIHNSNGNLDSQPYDRDGQCINSIDRALLNQGLLDEALALRSVRAFFHHKVVSIDFDGRVISVLDANAGEQVEKRFDLCIGADGSYSVVRRQLMRVVRMDFGQEYIPDDYIELKIPPGRDDHDKPTFLLDPNHLHIWPRHSFMLIALPNRDKSFTCTLFAPTTEFEKLLHADQILSWFRTQFPDALEFIGTDGLLNSFQRNPRNPLVSIKVCTLILTSYFIVFFPGPQAKPYHYKDRAIILGDAAHAMVPFYGQGLNCGLEDVRVLTALLHEAGVDPATVRDPDVFDRRLSEALCRYSESRHEDLVAINDLAMDNYAEMRHSVTTPGHKLKRMVDSVLFSLTCRTPVTLATLGVFPSGVTFLPERPRGWLPLYTMVTFRPDISYSRAKRKAAEQADVMAMVGSVALGVVVSVGVGWIALFYRRRRSYWQ
ncbi:FAD/NAD-P-binding domain-containing protein [Russula earlei]|uniref:FAD/NAD-P-binding domain-containing protein n=1 Tax=Russula earlei TaxID=71964 RepID=A0ACC0UH24_9AGAM|nr:FAD/NAD-P-binding domain-containing protein [Russula earlei]